MTPQRNTKRVCSLIGLALFAMMVIWLVGTTVGGIIINNMNPFLLSYNPWAIWLLNDIPLYALGMPVFLLILHFIKDGPDQPRDTKRLGVGKFLLLLVFAYGITYIANFLSIIFQYIIIAIFGNEGSMLSNSTLDMLVSSSSILPTIIFGAVVPAVGEEFMFRFMLRKKLRGASDITYIFFSALCFSMFHASLAQLLYAFLLGAVFAWVYLYTGKIWVPMIMHFIINLVGLVIAPMTLENPFATVILGLIVLAAAATAIVLLVIYHKRVVLTFMPPTEAGWPYAPSRRQMKYLYQQEQQQAILEGRIASPIDVYGFANVQPPGTVPTMQQPMQSMASPQQAAAPYSTAQPFSEPQRITYSPPYSTPGAEPQLNPYGYGGAPPAAPMYAPQQNTVYSPSPYFVQPPQGMPPYAAGVPSFSKQKSGLAKHCLINAGMLMYLIISTVFTIVNFLAVLL